VTTVIMMRDGMRMIMCMTPVVRVRMLAMMDFPGAVLVSATRVIRLVNMMMLTPLFFILAIVPMACLNRQR
jgi:hypothetical protein